MSEKPDQFKGYTPGPWRIRGERYKFIRVYATLGGIAHLDTVDSEGMENARLIAAAPSLLADNERLTADNERLKAEIERLRDELRQSGIDYTRAEVERLKAVALQAQNAAINLAKENERLKGLLKETRPFLWAMSADALLGRIAQALQEPPR